MNSTVLKTAISTSASPSVIVVLVHGTWPYGLLHSLLARFAFTRRWAKKSPQTWSNPEQPFRTGLVQAIGFDVRILEFFWSGFNGPHARRVAAVQLAEFVDHAADEGSTSGDTLVFIVAHSHGGNVAADACKLTKRAPAGLACMSTPFIAASRRRPTEAERLLFSYSGRLAVGFLILLACVVSYMLVAHFLKPFIPKIESWGLDLFATQLYAGMAAFIVLFFGVTFFVSKYVLERFGVRKAFENWLNGWTDWYAMRTPSVPCLVIRASGDEAFSALMLGQITNSVERVLTKALASVTHNFLARWWSELSYWIYLVLTVLWFYVVTRSQTILAALNTVEPEIIRTLGPGLEGWVEPVFLTLPLAFFSFIRLLRVAIVFLTTSISFLLAAIATLPFGPGNFLLIPWMELHVEPVLPDQKTETLFFSKGVLDEGKLAFRHAIYSIPKSWLTIGAWISTETSKTFQETSTVGDESPEL